MAIALYRKYRPKTFSEVIGQENIKKTILNSILAGRVGHAYIFFGARGIGKTTLARLFAKAINCRDKSAPEPCNKCQNCVEMNEGKALDLIEIDAASNRGIEEIRDLREKVRFTPSSMKYKVFVIDEVHMLTKEAFNALLKTLEEPPAHAVFLLATTDINKVLPTIISRCQRFDLKKLTVPEIVRYLSFITDKEHIDATKEALELVAQQSEGCARDSVSIFSQIISFADGKITHDVIKDILGVVDLAKVSEFVNSIIERNDKKGIKILYEISNESYDLEHFAKNLIEYLRKILIAKYADGGDDQILQDLSEEQMEVIKKQAQKIDMERLVMILKKFSTLPRVVKSADYPSLPLELALLEVNHDKGIEERTFSGANADLASKTLSKPSAIPSFKPESKKPQNSVIKNFIRKPNEVIKKVFPFRKENVSKEEPYETAKNVLEKSAETDLEIDSSKQNAGIAKLSLREINEGWKDVLDKISPTNHSVSAFLRMGKPVKIDKEKLSIAFKFNFHKERIAESKNKRLIEDAMKEIYGQKVLLSCILAKGEETNSKEVDSNVKGTPQKTQKDLVNIAKQIFK